MHNLAEKYRLRLIRKALLFRAARQFRRLKVVVDNTSRIQKSDVLLFAFVPAGAEQIVEFLDYHRELGVGHFLFISQGTEIHLSKSKDVSIWRSDETRDALNGLLRKFGIGHWCLTLQAEERFIYPHMDVRCLRALTDWLASSKKSGFGALQIDTYERNQQRFFDAGNYLYERDSKLQNLIVQGGARLRVDYGDNPQDSPNLARIPLVFWSKKSVYVEPSQTLLPRSLNNVYATNGGQEACGAITVPFSSANAWTPHSTKLQDWRQLEHYHLLSRGQWA